MKKQDLVNLVQALSYSGMGLIGEFIQKGGNTLLENHLSDFSLPAQYVTLSELFVKNRVLRNFTALVPPVLCTLHELGIVNLSSGALTYDPKDIMAYWAGAGLAFGISRLARFREKIELSSQ